MCILLELSTLEPEHMLAGVMMLIKELRLIILREVQNIQEEVSGNFYTRRL